MVFTAIAWASIHVQYGLYEIFWLVLTGLLLGCARKQTGSVVVPLVLLAVNNLAAAIEAALIG